MTDFPTSVLLSNRPARLVKHTVRYANHRAVNRDELTPMMRHYVEMKDQCPVRCCCIGWKTGLSDKAKYNSLFSMGYVTL